MPESPEVRIMSDFINKNSKDKKFIKIFNIEKGNIPTEYLSSEFIISSECSGKELKLNLQFEYDVIPIYVFMGMSGNWKYVPTTQWLETKFSRLRLDDESGNSLLLYGGYMGPKYSINKPFGGVKRGPDSTKDFNVFKQNILNNLDKKDFDKPIYEVLLNQKYFNGIGNYIRSTILYYLDENPFTTARDIITKRPDILELCKEVQLKSYELHGGQLRDWKNPFDMNADSFLKWVYYKKGLSIKDSNNRTFWFDPKWKA